MSLTIPSFFFLLQKGFVIAYICILLSLSCLWLQWWSFCASDHERLPLTRHEFYFWDRLEAAKVLKHRFWQKSTSWSTVSRASSVISKVNRKAKRVVDSSSRFQTTWGGGGGMMRSWFLILCLWTWEQRNEFSVASCSWPILCESFHHRIFFFFFFYFILFVSVMRPAPAPGSDFSITHRPLNETVPWQEDCR